MPRRTDRGILCQCRLLGQGRLTRGRLSVLLAMPRGYIGDFGFVPSAAPPDRRTAGGATRRWCGAARCGTAGFMIGPQAALKRGWAKVANVSTMCCRSALVSDARRRVCVTWKLGSGPEGHLGPKGSFGSQEAVRALWAPVGLVGRWGPCPIGPGGPFPVPDTFAWPSAGFRG